LEYVKYFLCGVFEGFSGKTVVVTI